MTSRLFSLLVCGLLIFSSCNSSSNNKKEATTDSVEQSDSSTADNASTPDMHNSQTSLDWRGTYEGTIPCADCPGIDMTVNLNSDSTFTSTMVYQDRDVKPFKESGKFKWEADGNHIVLESGGAGQRFKVGENNITMVNSDPSDTTTSPLASEYKLTKKQ